METVKPTSAPNSSSEGVHTPIPAEPLPVKASDSDTKMRMMSIGRFMGRGSVPEKKEEIKKDVLQDGAAPVATSSAVIPEEPKKDEPQNIPVKEVEDDSLKVAEPKVGLKSDELAKYWEAEAKKHQSRADKIRTESESKVSVLQKQVDEGKQYKDLADKFTKDPIAFVREFVPDIAQTLASQGDPVRIIEAEVKTFRSQLDKQYKTELGEDWRFNDRESLEPGTPSFRYKLAVDDKISQLRQSYSDYVSSQRNKIENQKVEVENDKKKLKQDFGLTDEDLNSVTEWAKSNKLSYYNLAKIALFDKILQQKLATITPPLRTPSELVNTPGSKEPEKNKSQISPEAARVFSRLGRGIYN